MHTPAAARPMITRLALATLALVFGFGRTADAQSFEAGKGVLSRDGSTIFYHTETGDYTSQMPFTVCRWTAATGGVPIAVVPSGTYIDWVFVNTNGTVAVAELGGWDQASSTSISSIVRWTPSGGVNDAIGLSNFDGSSVAGVSADGSVLCGYSFAGNNYAPSTSRVFRWAADASPSGTTTDIGVLPGDTDADTYSTGTSEHGCEPMSADGTVIVGRSWNRNTGASHVFRWQKAASGTAGSMTKIMDMQPGGWLKTLFINPNGSVIVGRTNRNLPTIGYDYWRWTTAGRAVIAGLSGFERVSVAGVNGDGSVVAGTSSKGAGYPGDVPPGELTSRAFRWVAGSGTSGTSTDLGTLAGDTDADSDYYGGAISSDGTVVVGRSWNRNTGAMHLFRWQKNASGNLGTMSKMADLPSDSPGYSPIIEVEYINSNGTVIAGTVANSAGKKSAWRWTPAGMNMSIGLAGYPYEDGLRFNSDGSIISGFGYSGDSWGPEKARAIRWVAGTGVSGTTTDLGVLPGDTDAESDMYGGGMSDDGSVILGRSWNRALADAPKRLFRWQKNATGSGGVLTGITRAPATITQISPAFGRAAGGTTITITGTNLTDTSLVRINGVAATNVTVVSNTKLTAVTPAGTAGAREVSLSTPGGTVSKAAAFTYLTSPTIASVSPSSGISTGGTVITIVGTNLLGASVKVGGVAATSVVVNAAGTSLTAVTPPGTVGVKDVAVTTVVSTATKSAAFTYLGSPSITSVTPSAGPLTGGTSITVTGSNLLGATVKVGDVAATTVVVNAEGTSLTAKTPAGIVGAKTVSVTTVVGTATKASAFTYVALPTITTVTPVAGPAAGGTTVTIVGTNLLGATVKVGDMSATAVVVNASGTSLTAVTPASATAGAKGVSVVTPGGQATKALAFTYIPAPSITTVTPVAGPMGGGTQITIAGSNLAGAGVKLGDIAATSVVVNATGTSLTAVTPASTTAGAKSITVTTPGGPVTKASAFTYIPAPSITSVTPVAGPMGGGTQITIAGSNLTGAAVKLGDLAATSVVVNAAGTSLTAVTPAATTAGAKSITVTTLGGPVTKASAYTYVLAPSITSVTPPAGPMGGGTQITIAGSNLTGASVKLGDVAATSVVVNAAGTSLTAVTPAAATTGAKSITVATLGGTATKTTAFTYQPIPVVTSVTPSLGTTAGGTSIVVTGTGFVPGATILKIGGATALNVLTVSSTSIQATTPPGGSGAAAVQVTTAGGTGSKAGAFMYIAPPTITSVAPAQGLTSGGTNITIKGTSFTTATAVLIGSVPATLFTVDAADTITAVTPPGSAGARTVTVTNAVATATRANGFTYIASLTGGMPSGGPGDPGRLGKQSGEIPDHGSSAGATSSEGLGQRFTVLDYLQIIGERPDASTPCENDSAPTREGLAEPVAPIRGDEDATAPADTESAAHREAVIDLDADGEADICQLRRGDLNLDGTVSELDLPLLLLLLDSAPVQGIGDLDASGEIDYADVGMLLVSMTACHAS